MIKILFASETGNSENESYNLAYEIKKKLNIDIEVHSCDNFGVENLTDEDYIIFMISTSGQGDPPNNMKNFWEFLLVEDLPENSLEDWNFTMFGFGDSSYKKYNAMARKWYQRWISLGSKVFFKRELGDDCSNFGYIKDFNNWKNELIDFLKNHFKIKLVNEIKENPFSINFLNNKVENKNDNFTKVIENNLVSNPNHFQKIYIMEMDNKNNIKYKPGDIVKIKPKIDTDLAWKFINLLGLNDNDFIEININPIFKNIYGNKFEKNIFSIKELFTEVLNYIKPVNFSFFKLISEYIDEDNIYKEKIIDMDYNEFFEYVYREKRNLFEILKDFGNIKLPLDILIQYLPLIQERDYSISNSYLNDNNIITIQYSLIDYLTPFKRKIKGLCTNYLSNLKKGNDIELKIIKGCNEFISNNKNLKQIIICTGTGISPFLSLIQEKLSNKILNKNNTYLYFGCRNKNNDFVNKIFLDDLSERDLITLKTAFSRDQNEKIYVQHLIDQDEIFFKNLFENIDLLNIHIYICGNSKFLPISIEKSLRNILNKYFNKDDKLDFLIENKQYILESWS